MTLIGKTIDRYRILEQLGQGGMAVVYLAEDEQVGRKVAVKLLPREYLHDDRFRERFKREAATSAQLEHPAIVPTYDNGEVDGQPYIVMRHMAGGSLKQRLAAGRLSDSVALKILEQVAEALEYAHSKRVVHRDLKPANILFDEHGKAHVADFGIAKLQEATTELTGTGIVGTPAYMSPEQVQGDKALDGHSDQYSLGIIAFELLTGEKPYTADTPARLLMKHVLEPVPRILAHRADLPAGVERVIQKALAKEPAARYDTPLQFVHSLEEALAGKDFSDETVDLQNTGLQPAPSRQESLPDDHETQDEKSAGAARPRPDPGLGRGLLFTCGGLAALAVLGLVVAGGVWLFQSLAGGGNATDPAGVFFPTSPVQSASSPTRTATARPASAAASATPRPTATEASTAVGDWIAFHSNYGGSFNLFRVNWRTKDVEQITFTSSHENVPRWAPDGKRLVFQSYADGNWEIYILNLNNDRLTRLTSNSCADWAPHWSPDAKKIAFYSDCDGNREIYVMNADGSNRKQLTFTSGVNTYNWFPTWIPDSSQILFASNRNGRYAVFVMDADGGNQRQLAAGCSPEMSPDGRTILFTQYCTDSGNIFLMDADGGDVRTLLEGDFRNPTWSPDGTMIAYQQGDNDRFEIWIMNADGTGQQKLTSLNAESAVPAWQP